MMAGEYDFTAASNGAFSGTTNNNSFSTQNSGWYNNDSVYNMSSSFQTEPEDSWWASMQSTYKEYEKPINGIVGGAITEGAKWYQEAQKQERLDKQFNMSREDSNAWREQQMAQQQAQFDAQLALQQAIFDDKVQTRARHNASIAVKPASAKKVSFGGK